MRKEIRDKPYPTRQAPAAAENQRSSGPIPLSNFSENGKFPAMVFSHNKFNLYTVASRQSKSFASTSIGRANSVPTKLRGRRRKKGRPELGHRRLLLQAARLDINLCHVNLKSYKSTPPLRYAGDVAQCRNSHQCSARSARCRSDEREQLGCAAVGARWHGRSRRRHDDRPDRSLSLCR